VKEEKMDTDMSIIDVCGKRTLEYVCDCLARFSRGLTPITIRALGGNVSKAVEIAWILSREFGMRITGSRLDSFSMPVDGVDLPCMEITVEYEHLSDRSSPSLEYDKRVSKFFVDYPVYHLLLDWLLFQSRELMLLDHNNTRLITVREEYGALKCQREQSYEDEHKDRIYRDGIRDAFYRSGLLVPPNCLPPHWKEIAQKIAIFDDVILGIDTNILFNCTISEHLIPALSLMNPAEYFHTPNWLLFVVPSAVMHEIEGAANAREEQGFLRFEGRMGFRALQEIIGLTQVKDIAGVSLTIAGEYNPALDTRVELQGLREDFCKREGRSWRSRKSSSGDMIIRDQFKRFLRDMNFHKGAYFLTADKSNAALARGEGLSPIYFRSPHRYYLERTEFTPCSISEAGGGKRITMGIPIGKLVYEMAVQFGTVKIKPVPDGAPQRGDTEIEMQCDAKGESPDNWVYRRLLISAESFANLKNRYGGTLDLNAVRRKWDNLIRRIEPEEY